MLRVPVPNDGTIDTVFQWAPTLGGECYKRRLEERRARELVSMGTHPWG